MRTLHVVQTLFCAGLERIVVSMLQRSYEDCFIFVLQHSEDETIQNWPSLRDYKEHILFAQLDLNGKAKTIHFLKETYKKLSITAIHTHYTSPLLYTFLATLGKKLTHIHTEHDSWHLQIWKNRIIEQIILGSKKTIKLVAVSKKIQAELENYFSHHFATLIYNGIDINEFYPKGNQDARELLNLPKSTILIGNVGRLVPIKGQLYLIQAIKELPEQYHLAIAGDGPLLEELIHLTNQLNISQRVHFCGFIENPNLFYQACDLFCLPSLDEGLPLALLEAQATNLPAICTEVGGCKEALDPKSSILIEPKNSHAIAQACLQILNKKGSPRDFIIKNFSLDTMLEKYNKLYQDSENAQAKNR